MCSRSSRASRRARPSCTAASRRRRPTEAPPAGAPLVVALGRIVRDKGFDVLVDAFASVVRARPDARLLIAGDGAEHVRLGEQVRRLGLEKVVELPGWGRAGRRAGASPMRIGGRRPVTLAGGVRPRGAASGTRRAACCRRLTSVGSQRWSKTVRRGCWWRARTRTRWRARSFWCSRIHAARVLSASALASGRSSASPGPPTSTPYDALYAQLAG